VGIVAPEGRSGVTFPIVANPSGAPGQRRARGAAPGDRSQQRVPTEPRARSRQGRLPVEDRESERERRVRRRNEDNDLPLEVREELRGAVGPDRAAGLERRLGIATRAYERDRYL